MANMSYLQQQAMEHVTSMSNKELADFAQLVADEAQARLQRNLLNNKLHKLELDRTLQRSRQRRHERR